MDFLGIQLDPLALSREYAGRVAELSSRRIALHSLLSIVPNEDVTHGSACYFTLDHDSPAIAGAFVYPPGGGQGWHTNSNLPGTRVYAAWSENGSSGMVFYENGEMRVDRDKPGWNVRAFKVPCWHAVWAECWRISIGFNVAGDK